MNNIQKTILYKLSLPFYDPQVSKEEMIGHPISFYIQCLDINPLSIKHFPDYIKTDYLIIKKAKFEHCFISSFFKDVRLPKDEIIPFMTAHMNEKFSVYKEIIINSILPHINDTAFIENILKYIDEHKLHLHTHTPNLLIEMEEAATTNHPLIYQFILQITLSFKLSISAFLSFKKITFSPAIDNLTEINENKAKLFSNFPKEELPFLLFLQDNFIKEKDNSIFHNFFQGVNFFNNNGFYENFNKISQHINKSLYKMYDPSLHNEYSHEFISELLQNGIILFNFLHLYEHYVIYYKNKYYIFNQNYVTEIANSLFELPLFSLRYDLEHSNSETTTNLLEQDWTIYKNICHKFGFDIDIDKTNIRKELQISELQESLPHELLGVDTLNILINVFQNIQFNVSLIPNKKEAKIFLDTYYFYEEERNNLINHDLGYNLYDFYLMNRKFKIMHDGFVLEIIHEGSYKRLKPIATSLFSLLEKLYIFNDISHSLYTNITSNEEVKRNIFLSDTILKINSNNPIWNVLIETDCRNIKLLQ